MSRPSLAAYTELSRDLLRRHLQIHMELGLSRQLGLLADPAFRDRVARTLS